MKIGDLRRYRMLSMNAYASVLFAFPLMVVNLASGSQVMGVLNGLAGLGFILNLACIRRHQSLNVAGIVAVVLTLLSMGAEVYFNGGFFSPSIDFLQLMPLLAVAVWGHRIAQYTTVATLTMLLWFWWAVPPDLVFSSFFEEGAVALGYRLATLVGVILLLEMIEFVRRMVRALVAQTRSALTRVKKTGAEPLQAQHLMTLAQLASGIGHEINTPLAIAMGHLEIAMDAQRAGRDPVLNINEAQQALNKTAELITDLRLYSLGGRMAASRGDLRAAATTAINILENELHHRAVLHVDLQSGLEVVGDTALWTRVLVQLLINTCNAIDTGRADENEIRLCLRAVDDGAEVIVEHTDRSLPEGQKEWHLEVQELAEGDGGIGSFLNKVFVANIGGVLTVENRLDGPGVRSRVWVPFQRVSEED